MITEENIVGATFEAIPDTKYVTGCIVGVNHVVVEYVRIGFPYKLTIKFTVDYIESWKPKGMQAPSINNNQKGAVSDKRINFN